MKKYNIFFYLLLLISCAGTSIPSNTSISVSSISSADSGSISSISTSSNSSESSESESILSEVSQKEIDKQLLSQLDAKICAFEGKVKSSTNETIKTNYYLTDSDPLTITMKSNSVATRYGTGEKGPITDTIGKIAFLDDFTNTYGDEENYETQVFYDEKNFYRITVYEESGSQKDVIQHVSGYEETNLSISFTNEESQNIKAMIQMVDNENYKVEYMGIENFVDNGVWSYAYRVTAYEDDLSTPSQTIIYNNLLTIENSVIVKAEIEYENALYAGGIKTNWLTVLSTTTYVQGEFEEFTGTYFNPSDYN